MRRRDAHEQDVRTEVVFPSLNLRRALPLNEAVAVECTPKSSGEIGFICGMNMVRGTVVVQRVSLKRTRKHWLTRPKWNLVLCQNCVTYPPTLPVNIVTYGCIAKYFVVAGTD
jgi:hypothetical protein